MHKRLRDFIGDNVLSIDLTQIRGLDDLNQPEGPILEAMRLAAAKIGLPTKLITREHAE